MQYPREELSQVEALNIFKQAFNSVNEILVLFQENGVVVETNTLADSYCRTAHYFNVGDYLWKENLWLSDYDRKRCREAFEQALLQGQSEFYANIQGPYDQAIHCFFSIKVINASVGSSRYFLMIGQRGHYED